jgi:hypothetical protein
MMLENNTSILVKGDSLVDSLAVRRRRRRGCRLVPIDIEA